jgi:hypothetical protein
MKKILFIILAITVISCNSNNNKNLSSPDGKIKIDFRIDNGVPSYSVKKNNSTIVNDRNGYSIFKWNRFIWKSIYN